MDRIFRRDGLSPVVKRELRNVRLENRWTDFKFVFVFC